MKAKLWKKMRRNIIVSYLILCLRVCKIERLYFDNYFAASLELLYNRDDDSNDDPLPMASSTMWEKSHEDGLERANESDGEHSFSPTIGLSYQKCILIRINTSTWFYVFHTKGTDRGNDSTHQPVVAHNFNEIVGSNSLSSIDNTRLTLQSEPLSNSATLLGSSNAGAKKSRQSLAYQCKNKPVIVSTLAEFR